jgi:teichuronic acid biosynthesis glycosyltransferase TuaG
MELVSIVLPTYNSDSYISETISSVINQSYTNWELIVVNDGSTDTTDSIINSLVATENRIKYISKTNSGVSNSRNAGIAIAKGSFIAFLDADDVWKTDNLLEKINLLNTNNCDVVYSKCELIDENSTKIGKEYGGSDYPSLNDILLLKGNYITAPSGVIFKKPVIDQIGGFDPNLSNNADQDIWIRALLANFRISYLSKVLWQYRVHTHNMSSNIKLLESDSIYMFDKTFKNNIHLTSTFKRKCYSKLYLMLAGSWWKNGYNKKRGMYFISKAFITSPLSIFNLLK